jgi:hypothetical protein
VPADGDPGPPGALLAGQNRGAASRSAQGAQGLKRPFLWIETLRNIIQPSRAGIRFHTNIFAEAFKAVAGLMVGRYSHSIVPGGLLVTS